MRRPRISLLVACGVILTASLAEAQDGARQGAVVQAVLPPQMNDSRNDATGQLQLRSRGPVPAGAVVPASGMETAGRVRMAGGAAMHPGMMPPGGTYPAYPPGAGTGVARASYDQPHLPAYAWPSYAAHPNYAALTYPRQYSATAWPYIGPFYPYPQVPLGWRKVQLEWDDGWWFLDFKD